MQVREASSDDLGRVMEIYDVARSFMRANGNDVQWVNGYPSRELVEKDLVNGNLLVCEHAGEVAAVMAFIKGPDRTYSLIEDGSWLSDLPYFVVHRLAVGMPGLGLGGHCLRWAVDEAARLGCDLRCDTHELNVPMRRALARAGLVPCGIIYVEDGTPRMAFQTP